ncbi:trigger factor [bacterium]|nr:trigger factor [bacterium]
MSLKIKVKKEKLPSSTVKLTITVPLSEWKKVEVRVVSESAKFVNLPGFRPGKAPERLVRAQLGEDKLAQEVLERILPLSFGEAIKQAKIRPVGEPKVKITQFEAGKDFVYEVECAVWPKVKLPDYRKIKVKKPKVSVSEKEVKEELEALKKRLQPYKATKEAIKEGDRVQLDYRGRIEGRIIPSLLKRKTWVLVSKDAVLPGFGKHLLGRKAGDKFTFSLKLPKDFPEQGLANQEVEFEVKIHRALRPSSISLSEIAKKLGYKNTEELKKRLKETIQRQKEEEAERKWEREILEKIAKKTKMELPPQLVLEEENRLWQQFSYDLALQGLSLETFLSRAKAKKEDLRKQFQAQAEKNLQHSFILHEIAKREKIKVSDKELKEVVTKERWRLRQMGYPEDEITRYLESEERKRELRTEAKLRKVLDFLKTLNK